jgi:hypothetical protein
MIPEFLKLVFLSIACGAISMTVSKSLFFLPLRRWIKNRSTWAWEGISCPFCTSHWVALLLMVVYFPRPFTQGVFFDFVVGTMMMVALASITARVIYSSYSVMAD